MPKAASSSNSSAPCKVTGPPASFWAAKSSKSPRRSCRGRSASRSATSSCRSTARRGWRRWWSPERPTGTGRAPFCTRRRPRLRLPGCGCLRCGPRRLFTRAARKSRATRCCYTGWRRGISGCGGRSTMPAIFTPGPRTWPSTRCICVPWTRRRPRRCRSMRPTIRRWSTRTTRPRRMRRCPRI